ncbi:TetR/AcrR family transcriptional regulator [Ktedonosporobacter rubrisoli]|uniref:TetR/AcrR family transcriptional regulator n=1 Tax=Ktedonosporobacter rubrisoli TaxID=2509675 RepID=A0A4P6JNV5_KTERU|nr:TetR/AcrR family transcriptional regulator [Ktedonosporobacter rubrisoli]QBD77008.1 TetR/AcrR family transcriptional regulator [Ktedonosporobacter rubrisoli]
MIEQPRIDRRIQRTRQLLSDALLALIVERGYEIITVQDITVKANIGRTTFYMHYRDKEELLAASVQRLVKELRQEIEAGTEELCTYRTLIILVFQHIAQHYRLYRVLLGRGGIR